MNWIDILKVKQIVTPTTDINIKKVPKKDKGTCNTELKALVDDWSQNVYSKITHEEEHEVPDDRFLGADNEIDFRKAWQSHDNPKIPENWRGSKERGSSNSEFVRAHYRPMPEKVACFALDIYNGKYETKGWESSRNLGLTEGEEMHYLIRGWQLGFEGFMVKVLTDSKYIDAVHTHGDTSEIEYLLYFEHIRGWRER